MASLKTLFPQCTFHTRRVPLHSYKYKQILRALITSINTKKTCATLSYKPVNLSMPKKA
jgi:hypothetical protein